MALAEASSLDQRFKYAQGLLDGVVVGTYQGYVKASCRLSPGLLPQVTDHLRLQLRRLIDRHWLTHGFVVLGVDGSMLDLPRTQANEQVFGATAKKKNSPQALLCNILHLRTGLPWAWRIGKAKASERHLLLEMTHLLPEQTLLVMDAGFTGYDFLKQLIDQDHHVLVRAAGNLKLLRDMGYYVQEKDGIVYLWPDKALKGKQPPLIFYLIRVRRGRRTMCLITSVLDRQMLSDRQLIEFYRWRWGIELWFRSLKQTLGHSKCKSKAPAKAQLEMQWAMVAAQLLGMMTVRELIAAGDPPLKLSVAQACNAVRAMMQNALQQCPRTELADQLRAARKDDYQRKRPKAARNWPHKKRDTPPGLPRIQQATQTQIKAANELLAKQHHA